MAAAYQLPPMPRALAVFDHMIAPQTQTLVLKEKMFDSFDIKRLDGVPAMRGEGKVLTWHGRKSIYDLSGNHLFDIVKKHWHVHTTFAVEGTSQGNVPIMEVKSSFKLIGSEARATFKAGDGTFVSLLMKGNWFDTSAEIVNEATGAVVARIDRKLLNARELILGHQTYHLTIAPGVDMSLLVAMCMCLDAKNNEK